MSKYFESFPRIDYQMKKGDTPKRITDITRRVGFRKDFLEYVSDYYKEVLSSASRPEMLASSAYRDSYKNWILMMANDVVDPYHDWVKDYAAFEEYVDKRYPNRYIVVSIQSSLGSLSTDTNLPETGERIWNTLIHGTVSGTFQTGEYVRETETGVEAYALLANHTNVNSETGIVPTGLTGGDYFTKGNTIVGLTSGATATVTDHRSAEVMESNREFSQMTYKMVSPSTSGTSFSEDDYILTDRQLFSLVSSDGLERYAPRYYEISKTNDDNTVEKMQTNKTLSADEISNLPSGFSTTPTAVTNLEYENRKNNALREVYVVNISNIGDIEQELTSKMER